MVDELSLEMHFKKSPQQVISPVQSYWMQSCGDSGVQRFTWSECTLVPVSRIFASFVCATGTR